MSFSATCPHCGSKMKAPDKAEGKQGICRRCQTEFTVSKEIFLLDKPVQTPEPELEAVINLTEEFGFQNKRPENNPATEPVKLEKRFSSIRTLAFVFAIISYFIGGVGVFSGVMIIANSGEMPGSIEVGVAVFVASVVQAFFFSLVKEGIYLALAVEENTRRTALSIEKIRMED